MHHVIKPRSDHKQLWAQRNPILRSVWDGTPHLCRSSSQVRITNTGDTCGLLRFKNMATEWSSPDHDALYHYSPLMGTQIRIIHLEHGEDSDPLRCSIEHVDLSSKPIFSAISYVCGDPKRSRAASWLTIGFGYVLPSSTPASLSVDAGAFQGLCTQSSGNPDNSGTQCRTYLPVGSNFSPWRIGLKILK